MGWRNRGRSRVKNEPNQSVQPTRGSRFTQRIFERQGRLPLVADAHRWAAWPLANL
jgi:hypothetical protein